MSEEIAIIGKQLDAMANVFNVVPGEAFRSPASETLLIIQRRMKQSDLLTALSQFNGIFAKTAGATIEDLCKSAVAFVGIKCLVEEGADDFTPRQIRKLIKEYQNQITKVNNIIHLSKVNAMTAEEYQRETIRRTQEKNEAFLEAFEQEIVALQKQIEQEPALDQEEIIVPKRKVKREKAKDPQKKSNLLEVSEKLGEAFFARKNQREIEERLREEEKEKARTGCEEIPFYEKSLSYTELFTCKDIPAYSLMKRKSNVYFGLSKNVEKGSYDNQDESLVELTKVTDEFVQYMTEDLLSGEYVMKPFSQEEKKSMQMYFDFMSRCFEQHIGITLTVQEYLLFKDYYNQVVCLMFELEQKQKEDYYRALILADLYRSYMESYDLECADEEQMVIENIMKDQSADYQEDIALIIANHIVNTDAKEELLDLQAGIRDFHKPEIGQEVQIEQPQTEQAQEKENQPTDQIAQAEDLEQIQIVIQLLDSQSQIEDEAIYAGANISQAIFDYANKEAYRKRIGFRRDGIDTYFKEEVSK